MLRKRGTKLWIFGAELPNKRMEVQVLLFVGPCTNYFHIYGRLVFGSKWPVLKLGKLWPELVQFGRNWKVGPTFEFNRIPSSWREGHCKINFRTEENSEKKTQREFWAKSLRKHSIYQWAISEFVIDELLFSIVIRINFLKKPKDIEYYILTNMIGNDNKEKHCV